MIIPVFAVGRAQTILHLLARLRTEGRIPSLPSYLNSPMAVDATELFLRTTGVVVSIVHGVPAAAEALRRRVHLELGWDAHVPALLSATTVAPEQHGVDTEDLRPTSP